MPTLDNIPKIHVYIDSENVDEGARKVLAVIRPEWSKVPQEKIKYKIFSDGLTNKLFGYYVEDEPENKVIIKVYGVKTEIMINREKEIQTMRLLHKSKLGPELYATFENGHAYEFISGRTLDTDICKNPSTFRLVAAEMGRFHSVKENGENGDSKKSVIWEIFERINQLTEEALTTNEELISIFEKVGISSGWGVKVMNEFKELIERENMPLGFCHNDLLLGNVIYNEKKSKVYFIDFEYCGMNYTPFDVANHFCEFAGGNDTDFSLCPDETFQAEWISIYLKYLFDGNHSYDVQTFQRWVNICAPLSLVGWILWGIAQANNSKIEFDYIEYVMIRIPEYEKLLRKMRPMKQT